MARTRQTARKSTGGAAPRKRLCGSGQPPGYYNYGKRPLQHRMVSKKIMTSNTAMIPHKAITSDAQQRVLSTPDLLITILSQLPHSALLKAKLVNRTWASLFEHVEIQAALFKHPRPKESALYTETYSDILMDNFSTFWPINGEDKAEFSRGSVKKKFHSQESNEIPADVLKIHDQSETHLQKATTLQPQLEGNTDKCQYSQWRQLLICQPAIEALEIVQQVSRRGGGTLEFRTIIPRPNGVRMGFLYDAVRHWHEVERSPAELLWNRKTGDLVNSSIYYVDGSSFKTAESKPCVTIWGKTSVGCGQHGGLTYRNYVPAREGQTYKPRVQIIESGDEEVEFYMSEPKIISFYLGLRLREDEDDEEDEEDETNPA